MPLTVCPLSNVRLRCVDTMADHPLPRMLDAGLVVTINSDDPAYFGGYVGDNYRAVQQAFRFSDGRPGRAGQGLDRCGVPHMTNWAAGEWLNPPVAVAADGDDLLVTAAGGSDLWQGTYYGFHRDNGHALLAPFAEGSAVEVSFVVDYQSLYDQAGLLVRVDETTWVKTGVEISDGIPQLSAVVTHGDSDWSTAPVPEWAGATVTLRASWDRQALILRARVGDGPGACSGSRRSPPPITPPRARTAAPPNATA